MKKYLFYLSLLVILITNCTDDISIDDVEIPVLTDQIMGKAEVDASNSSYYETEYFMSNRDPQLYYFWEVSSGTLLTDQGKGNIFIKFKAVKSGVFSDVIVKVKVYSKYPSENFSEFTKTVKVK